MIEARRSAQDDISKEHAHNNIMNIATDAEEILDADPSSFPPIRGGVDVRDVRSKTFTLSQNEELLSEDRINGIIYNI